MRAKILRIGAALTLGIATLLLTAADDSANAAPPTSVLHRGFRHHHARTFAPMYYGGYLSDLAWADDWAQPMPTASLPARLDPMIDAPPALACTRSRESITVPMEQGGTRVVTVTRCCRS